MLKMKSQYFGHLMWSIDSFIWKDPDSGNNWRQEEKGMAEDEMLGWHHQLYGHEFDYALVVGDTQVSQACCIPWDCKNLDMTEWMNWTERRECQAIPLFLPLEPQKQYKRQKYITLEDEPLPSTGRKVSVMLLKKTREIAPERMKRLGQNVTGKKWAGHNFWKEDIAQGHIINRLESNGSKMADKSIFLRPWSSISRLNDTPRGTMTFPRHYQKTKKWTVPHFLEISIPS